MKRVLVMIASLAVSGLIVPGPFLLSAQEVSTESIPLDRLLAPPPLEEDCLTVYPEQDESGRILDDSTSVPDHVDDPILVNLVELQSKSTSIGRFALGARKNVSRYIDVWGNLAEEGPDGTIVLKDGAIENLFSEARFEYECIIYGAQAYYDDLTGEEFKRANAATLLVAARLIDLLNDELNKKNITAEQRTNYELLLESAKEKEQQLNEVKNSLDEILEDLNRRIQNLREKKKHVVYALVIGKVELAIQQLIGIVNDVREVTNMIDIITTNIPPPG